MRRVAHPTLRVNEDLVGTVGVGRTAVALLVAAVGVGARAASGATSALASPPRRERCAEGEQEEREDVEIAGEALDERWEREGTRAASWRR